MKLTNVQPSTFIEYGVENNEKILTSKLLIEWGYQNIKMICKGLHSKLVW